MRTRHALLAISLALPLCANAWVLPYAKPAGKYPSATTGDSSAWASNLNSWWNTWKNSYITSNGDPHDPSGYTVPAIQGNVSEGVGYAMLFSVLMNDSATFRKVWFNAERYYWLQQPGVPLGWYSWCKNSSCGSNKSSDSAAATDGDEDIGLALIYATALAKMGYWPNYTYIGTHRLPGGGSSSTDTVNLEQKAANVVKSIGKYMVSGAAYPLPDYILPNSATYPMKNAAGAYITLLNPSYFAPGWYQVFSDFSSYKGIASASWSNVIANSYSVISKQHGAASGMVQDWSLETGDNIPTNLGFGVSSSGFGTWMWWDAIRAPWRLGMDAIWNGSSAAYAYCKKPWNSSVNGLGASASDPGMYNNLTGTPSNPGGYSPAIGPHAMWAVAALGGSLSGDANSKSASAKLAATVKNESMTGNKYFDDALHLMGGLAVSGNFPNIWADLRSSFPDTSAVLKTALKVSKVQATALSDTVLFTATFNKAVTCTLWITGNTSGAIQRYIIPSATTQLSQKWLAGTRIKGTFAGNGAETVTAVLKWPRTTTPSASDSVTLKVCPAEGTCSSVGIENAAAADRPYLFHALDGSMKIHQPWFGTSTVRVRLRNAAGMALYQNAVRPEGGVVRVPAFSLAPGWYAIETESNGNRAVQSFTMSR